MKQLCVALMAFLMIQFGYGQNGGVGVSYNFDVRSPKGIDAKKDSLCAGKSCPFTTLKGANDWTPKAYRYIGLEKNLIINGVPKKYWYQGGVEDVNLVEQPTGGSGDFIAVADLTARDAIPSGQRKIGTVAALADGSKWQLIGGITNGDWVPFTAAVGTNGLYNSNGTDLKWRGTTSDAAKPVSDTDFLYGKNIKGYLRQSTDGYTAPFDTTLVGRMAEKYSDVIRPGIPSFISDFGESNLAGGPNNPDSTFFPMYYKLFEDYYGLYHQRTPVLTDFTQASYHAFDILGGGGWHFGGGIGGAGGNDLTSLGDSSVIHPNTDSLPYAYVGLWANIKPADVGKRVRTYANGILFKTDTFKVAGVHSMKSINDKANPDTVNKVRYSFAVDSGLNIVGLIKEEHTGRDMFVPVNNAIYGAHAGRFAYNVDVLSQITGDRDGAKGVFISSIGTTNEITPEKASPGQFDASLDLIFNRLITKGYQVYHMTPPGSLDTVYPTYEDRTKIQKSVSSRNGVSVAYWPSGYFWLAGRAPYLDIHANVEGHKYMVGSALYQWANSPLRGGTASKSIVNGVGYTLTDNIDGTKSMNFAGLIDRGTLSSKTNFDSITVTGLYTVLAPDSLDKQAAPEQGQVTLIVKTVPVSFYTRTDQMVIGESGNVQSRSFIPSLESKKPWVGNVTKGFIYGLDFNNYTAPGTYQTFDFVTALSFVHYPVQRGLALTVTAISGSDYDRKQETVDLDGGHYVRFRNNNGTWEAWRPVGGMVVNPFSGGNSGRISSDQTSNNDGTGGQFALTAANTDKRMIMGFNSTGDAYGFIKAWWLGAFPERVAISPDATGANGAGVVIGKSTALRSGAVLDVAGQTTTDDLNVVGSATLDHLIFTDAPTLSVGTKLMAVDFYNSVSRISFGSNLSFDVPTQTLNATIDTSTGTTHLATQGYVDRKVSTATTLYFQADESFSPIASQTTFELTHIPSGQVLFFNGGTKISPAYVSVSGGTVTYSGTALSAGADISITYIYQ